MSQIKLQKRVTDSVRFLQKPIPVCKSCCPVMKVKTMQTQMSLSRFLKSRMPSWLRSLPRRSRRSLARQTPEVLESRIVLSAQPLPVLMVIADQQDFYYQEYNDTRISLEAAGVDVVVAATTTNISTPHGNSGQGWENSGQVPPDIALNQVNSEDYSAIVFVGGWGSSMYQYSTFTGDYWNDQYDGDLATKTLVNDLINEFDAEEKYLGFICHATTIGAWSRVDGNSLFAGKQVSVPYIGSPAVLYEGVWYANQELGQYEQAVANGATANTVANQYGNPATAADDIVVDERLVTAQDWDSATLFGATIAQLVIDAANTPAPNQAPVATDAFGQIAEHSAFGTNVVQVAANDPDAGQILHWQIIGGNTGGAFQINAATGQISVANPVAINFETSPVFQLTVQVTDSDVADPLSDTATVTISLTDIVEAPPASVYRRGNDLVVQGSSGDDTIYVWSTQFSNQLGIWMNGVQYGSFVVSGGPRVVVFGGDGNDRIFATDARRPVEIFGEAGHDQITGGSSHDILDGGSGWDRITGGAGNDLIFGRDGNHFLYGGEGDDVIVGGNGDDTMDGYDGRDVLIGGAGSDYMNGGAGEDLLVGGSTTYDNDTALLIQLGFAWNTGTSASARAADLQNANAPGIKLRRGIEVLDDTTSDTICSGADIDLFYSGLNDGLWQDELDLFAV